MTRLKCTVGAVLAAVCISCGTSSPPPVASTPNAPTVGGERWIYRQYDSGIQSARESVATWDFDEARGTATRRTRARDGRDPLAWTDVETTTWKLSVSRASGLVVKLTGENGAAVSYTCSEQVMNVAPADAVRVSKGGESEWMAGNWSAPTRRVAVQQCRETPESPYDFMLAATPIEWLRADSECCGNELSLRSLPADGTVMPPRDPTFPASK